MSGTGRRCGSTKAMVDEMQTRAQFYETINLAGYEALDVSIIATMVPELA